MVDNFHKNCYILTVIKNNTFLKRQKMKKNFERHIETREEKEQRWAKQLKQARSFARQSGIAVIPRKQTLSDKFDY